MREHLIIFGILEEEIVTIESLGKHYRLSGSFKGGGGGGGGGG
jgi:hypothetical protein